MKNILVWAVGLGFGLFLPVLKASSPEFRAVYVLPAFIEQIHPLGDWRSSNSAGRCRLVITRAIKDSEQSTDRHRYKFFLQWTRGEQIISTVGIKEINQQADLAITELKTLEGAHTGNIRLHLQDNHTLTNYYAEIRLLDVGKYQFSVVD